MELVEASVEVREEASVGPEMGQEEALEEDKPGKEVLQIRIPFARGHASSDQRPPGLR